MSKDDSGFLLTAGDRERLVEVKALIEQAIAGNKRVTQLLPLLQAQEKLMGVVNWFITRDV